VELLPLRLGEPPAELPPAPQRTGAQACTGVACGRRLTSARPDRRSSKEVHVAAYVDGFVLPLPKRNLDAYRRVARKAGRIWREHGALEYRECVAEDVPVGEVTSFPRSVQVKRGETVVFAWIVFKSRAHRDRVNAKVMKDPRLADMMDPNARLFESKRMIYGGFDVIVDL
jgi:uncharacterized protein YbaA (DUF1428 family)